MKKIAIILASLFTFGLLAGVASAQVSPEQGWCELGGQKVLTSGSSSSTFVQASYPKCQVEVFLTGTTTHPTHIYSNTGLTVLGNPFTAQINGSWLLYADNGVGVDIVLSGGTPNPFPAPYTLINKIPGGGGSGGSGVTQIIAGANVNISPSGGTGAVTINSSGSGGGGVTGGIDTDNYIVNPPGNNGIANAVANAVCLASPSCYAVTPSTSTSTENPAAYHQPFFPLGQFGTRTTDYRGGAEVNTWNSPINPLAIGGAPFINNSSALAHLDFLNSLVSVPAQVFPEYGFDREYEIFAAPGGNNFVAGGPAFKTNYILGQDWAIYYQPGQHSGRSITQYGFSNGDFLSGYGSAGFPYASAGDPDDEGAHVNPNSLNQAQTFVTQCTAGCTTGSTSISVAGGGNNTMGVGLLFQDWAHATTPACHIVSQAFAGNPETSVVMAGSSCLPVSQMMLAASAAICPTVYQGGACGATNQAISATPGIAGFLTSTSGVPSSGVACVSSSNQVVGNDHFEMVNYTVTDSTHIQLTYANPHPSPAVISIGGSCGLTLVPTANVNGTVSQIVTNGASQQALMIVGSPDGTTAYLGNYANIAAVVGGNSRVAYQVITPVSLTGNGTTATFVSTDGAANFVYTGTTATISGATPSGFNGTFTIAKTGNGTFTYPSTGTGTATGTITLTMNYAQYSLVPAAVISDVLNPTTHQVDFNNITLEPNTVQFTAGSNTLVVPPGSNLNVQGEGDYQHIGQSAPVNNFVDFGYGDGGNGTIWEGIPAGSLSAIKEWNDASSSHYRGYGGTALSPIGVLSDRGVWGNILIGDAPDNAIMNFFCKPAPIGCSGFGAAYNIFSLQQSSVTGAYTTLQFDPITDTLNLSNQNNVVNLNVGNLTVNGNATIPRLAFPEGIQVGPSTAIPHTPPDCCSGNNYGFKNNSQVLAQTLGLNSEFLNGLVIGPCNQADGNSAVCAPPANATLDLSSVHAGYSSLMNGISVGLGIPTWEPVATAATVGTLQYAYVLEGCNTAGQCTPQPFASTPSTVLTATINTTNTVSIQCPAFLQNGYPIGTIYRLVRVDQTGLGGGDVNLGSCVLGTTVVDNGTVTTPNTEPLINYTATLGAGTIIDADLAAGVGNCVQIGTGGSLAATSAPCGTGGGSITLTTTGSSGAATLVGSTLNIPIYSGGGGSGTVTAVSSGNLSPLFTTSVATSTTTPAISYTLSTQSANTVFAGPASGGAAAPTFQTAPTISAANMSSFPTLNQNTTGSAAALTTSRNLAGNAFNGTANVPFVNKFIVQGTVDTGLTGAQFLGALGTGLVKNTTTTGVLSIATAGTDYLLPTGSATGLSKASAAAFGVSECDNVTITCSGGIFTSIAGTGTVTHTTSALTALHPTLGNAGADIKPDTVAVSDGAGNWTLASLVTNGAGPNSIQIGTNVFSALPTCNSGNEGKVAPVTDSTVNTWGSTIAGGSTNHVLAYCSGGGVWTVMAK